MEIIKTTITFTLKYRIDGVGRWRPLDSYADLASARIAACCYEARNDNDTTHILKTIRHREII